MAGIPKFDAQAPRLGNIEVTTRTGVPEMLASIAADTSRLTARLGAWADQAAKREGEQAGQAAAMQVQMPGVDFAFDGSSGATTPGKPGTTPGSAVSLIRSEEGFQARPYWDVDAYRVGYGSDTITLPDGSVRKTTPGMKISRDDAERDLSRRLGQFAASANRDTGGAFAALPEAAKTGLLSVAYNYGSLPSSIVDAVKSGNVETIAGAVSKLSANPKRRQREAAIIRGATVDPTATAATAATAAPAGKPAGLVEAGNIDLAHRPVVNNQDGTISTVRSMSFEEDGKEILIPTVSPDGKILSDKAAIELYRKTGQHLGKFDNAADATSYAKQLHESQAQFYGGGGQTPAGAVKVTLTGALAPTPQVAAGTIRGDAYNNAAMNIAVNRADTAMRGQMDALALQYDGQPAELSNALDALRAGYVRDQPPAMAAMIDDSFSRQKLSLVRQAVDKFNSNLESANQAAFEENIAARTASVYRLAAAGGTDAQADAAISGELGALTQSIDSSPLTPLQKSRQKADAVAGIISARVLGGFEAQKDPAARAAYAQKFQADWQAGEGLVGQMDIKTYDSVNGELVRRLQADEVAANKRSAALDKTIEGQISTLKKGWPVPDANRTLLHNEVAKTGDAQLSANLDFLDSLANWQKAHIASRPEVIDAQINAMQAKIQKEGASDAALTTLDVMEGLRDEMKKGLSADPLTWANRAGVAQVDPLDFSDSEHLAASITERVNDATAIAQHYGIQPKYFTAAETDGLTKMIKQTPLALPSIISSLTAGFGSATPQALAEISKDAPVLAHVAALVNTTGDQRPAIEIANVLDRRNQPGYKSPLPPAGKLQSAAAKEIGPALLTLPNTMSSTVETASTLFEARAAARGIDMEQFDTEGSPARELYLDTLDEVLGATKRDGVKYGGLTAVNGLATVAPPDIEAASVQGMVQNLSADDMLFQKAIGTANGVPIAISDLRKGQLVMTSIGKYRIALGDIANGDPRYVPGANGGYFELDLGMLQRTQKPRLGDQVLPTNPGNFR